MLGGFNVFGTLMPSWARNCFIIIFPNVSSFRTYIVVSYVMARQVEESVQQWWHQKTI